MLKLSGLIIQICYIVKAREKVLLMKKNKILVIINSAYPFDKGESFMGNEIPFIHQFDKVIICPCSVENFNQTRKMDNDRAILCPISQDKKIVKLLKCFYSLFLKKTMLEIIFLCKNKRFNKETLKQLLLFVSTSNTLFKKIKNNLIFNGIKETDSIVFYSYWMHFHAYTALLLKNYFVNSKAVSRCHGYDLYEYRNMNKYLPLRKSILEELDVIFPISLDGIHYLEIEYPNYKKNIQISRLGTRDCGVRKPEVIREPFKIVSCSWIVPVKRVNKIVDALLQIKDIEIEWTHFGEGELFDELKRYSKKILCKNIKVNLNGAISNQELQEKYLTNDYDVFINVSESEGIPVSIMEANSFGIPVIATDVGGVNEIVFDGENGILLDKEFSDKQLIEAIYKFVLMTNEEYLKYRDNARKIWMKLYNAEKNYSKFFNEINEI